MKQPRVKVNAHVVLWRGLLLVYGCTVFGDTSESMDEVLVHAFFFCLCSRIFRTIKTNNLYLNFNSKNMKTISKFLAMLLFVVSSFGFASCSEDDDNGGNGGGITINGESYELGACHASYDKNYGIYLSIEAAYGKNLKLVLPSKKFSGLTAGDVFDNDDFYVNKFCDIRGGWENVGGSIFIADIKESSLIIRIENLKILDNFGYSYIINGTATLYHSSHDSNGNILPFPKN